MSNLNLTKEQRLILANQYKILNILQPDEGYDKFSDALISGHSWIYNNCLGLHVEDEFSKSDSDYVLNVLRMYEFLINSYEDLSDKSGINISDVTFAGFDHNRENEYASFVSGLYKIQYFSNVIKEASLNSHIPLKNKYDTMLAKWESVGTSKYPLTKEDILKIISN